MTLDVHTYMHTCSSFFSPNEPPFTHTHTHTYSGSVAVSLALILGAGPCCINLKSLFKAKSRFGTCYRFQIHGAARGEGVCVWGGLRWGGVQYRHCLSFPLETPRGGVECCALNGCSRPREPRQIWTNARRWLRRSSFFVFVSSSTASPRLSTNKMAVMIAGAIAYGCQGRAPDRGTPFEIGKFINLYRNRTVHDMNICFEDNLSSPSSAPSTVPHVRWTTLRC